MNQIRIHAVTGARSDYGIQRTVWTRMQESARLELIPVVTGMHLSPRFGRTVEAIEKDGFPIRHRIEMDLTEDDDEAITKAAGTAVAGFASVWSKDRPDLVFLTGDRFETLAAGMAATLMRIPIAHLHGGEVTEGAIDEQIRHALSKMAHFHFVSASLHGERLIRMGEDPHRVFHVGAPGLDTLRSIPEASREEVYQWLGLSDPAPYLLVGYHPVSLSLEATKRELVALLEAAIGTCGFHIVLTQPNADHGSKWVEEEMQRFIQSHAERTVYVKNLGSHRFANVVRHASVMIGNSSSGLIEAPFLGCPTINIGDRQKGRLRGPTVIDVGSDVEEISRAIRIATSTEFKDTIQSGTSPYGDGKAAEKIVSTLESLPLNRIERKPFYEAK